MSTATTIPPSAITTPWTPAPGGAPADAAAGAPMMPLAPLHAAPALPTSLTIAQANQVNPIQNAVNSSEFSWLMILIAAVVAIVGAVMLAVPLFKGIGWLFRNFFFAIGWVVTHIFTFVRGVVTDAVRAVGAILASVFFVPMAVGNVVIGRWSAAAHYGRAIKEEVHVFGRSLFRVVIGHPARLLLLGGLTEGIEKRVPEAMRQAPGADTPPARVGQFDGYTIVGSLPTGGSGAKVYVAEPTPSKRAALARAGRGDLAQVVIKSFSLRDGSTMPQIVRESRALESARKLGLILDHELNDERFYYAMPYVPGDSLSVVTRKLHADAGLEGLRARNLSAALSHVSDLLEELSYYHRGGLWHKDVKPDNIIVNQGKAHLVDLGLVTPLRSAMTLTTHGTEYFRDPELVRMALRGAKVNEVDGVKFDLYGAGAVLYSIIENSFPAHGALSQITKVCPEALRWVIRRSMAEMHQRYATADEMLADLRAINASPDPFAIKPIDLPSMSGGGGSAAAGGAGGQPAFMPDLEPRIEPVNFARAGSAVPPVPPGSPAAEPPGFHRVVDVQKDNGFVFKAEMGVGAAGAAAGVAAAVAGTRKRPRLRLTDWWTGAYRVEGERVVMGADSFTAPGVEKVQKMPRAPGRTASEQLAAARQRVASAQARVRGRPHRAFVSSASKYDNRPNSGVLAAIGFVLLVIGGVFYMAQSKKSGSPFQEGGTGVEGFEVAVDGLPEGQVVMSVAALAPDEVPEAPEAPEVPEPPEMLELAEARERMAGDRAEIQQRVRDGLHALHGGQNALNEAQRTVARATTQSQHHGKAWLDNQVRRTKAILDARHPDNNQVTFASVASAAWEAFTSNASGNRQISTTVVTNVDGELERSVGSYSASASMLDSVPKPPHAESPLITGCCADGTVLLVSFVSPSAEGAPADHQDVLVRRLSDHGFCVVGLGATPEETDALAGAKAQIGTSTPADTDARERLRVWLDSRADIGAVLWVSNDERFAPRVMIRSSVEPEMKTDYRDALTAR
ncbi:MAG: serine/threonine protein kinase [Phycisphaerales bacterium]